MSYLVFKANLVVSILSIFPTKLLYSVFLTTSFLTTLLNLAKSSGTGVNLAMSNLSTPVFKLAKFVFDPELLTSTCVTFLKSGFVAYQLRANSTLMFLPELLMVESTDSFYKILFINPAIRRIVRSLPFDV